MIKWTSLGPGILSLSLSSSLQPCLHTLFILFCRGRIEGLTEAQSDPSVKLMMQNEFQGETAKNITCTKCGYSSQSSELFYELILTIQV